jgi:hypothetical protein
MILGVSKPSGDGSIASNVTNPIGASWIAIVLGTVGAIVTGTTIMGQLERALNRIRSITARMCVPLSSGTLASQ